MFCARSGEPEPAYSLISPYIFISPWDWLGCDIGAPCLFLLAVSSRISNFSPTANSPLHTEKDFCSRLFQRSVHTHFSGMFQENAWSAFHGEAPPFQTSGGRDPERSSLQFGGGDSHGAQSTPQVRQFPYPLWKLFYGWVAAKSSNRSGYSWQPRPAWSGRDGGRYVLWDGPAQAWNEARAPYFPRRADQL